VAAVTSPSLESAALPAAAPRWYTHRLEAMIRRASEQWFNFFDAWSAAPAS